MDKKTLLNLLSLGENQTIEFKSKADLKIIGKHVCAFLNGSGGFIVCGIDNYSIIGLEESDSIKSRLETQLSIDIKPSSLISIDIQNIEGKDLLIVEVPGGKDIPYSFKNNIYVREGASTKKADIEIITDMVMRKQIEPERWERRFSTLENLEILSSKELSKLFNSNKFIQDIDKSDNILHNLQKVSLAKYGRITNAADILFSENPGERHPQARVRAVCYTRKEDNKYQDLQQLDGPLTVVLEKLILFIERNTPTKAYFSNNKAIRDDIPLLPRDAIREGLVNAFAHRDYANFTGGIKVEVSPDKVVIWNSGSFPDGIDAEKLEKGNISILRNPDIAHILYILGYMEKLGRGSILIRKSCLNAGFPIPKWQSDKDIGVTLTFFTRQDSGQDSGQDNGQDSGQDSGQNSGQNIGEINKPITDSVARLITRFNGELTRKELQNVIKIKSRDTFLNNYLNPALKLDLIERTIPDKPTSRNQRYRLTKLGLRLKERITK